MKLTIPNLPFKLDVESKAVLKKTALAHRALAELKGVVRTIPNARILIHTLSLQEAKDSSAIENIITTHDDLFKGDVYPERAGELAAKEVQRYASALLLGFEKVKEKGLLTLNTICEIQGELEKNKAGFRKVPGTVLKNGSGETVYTPPQHPNEIASLMDNLEKYINDSSLEDFDILVKMAIIYYQFESIHPFYDGNGRTGRIINILYLVMNNLLDIPILYASRFIIQNKSEYYKLLQKSREYGDFEEWIMYMLTGIEQTALQTMTVVEAIVSLMEKLSVELKTDYSFYSRELLEALFMHPYTKVEFIQEATGVSRVTAQRHLALLVKDGVLSRYQLGRAYYYVNKELYHLLSDIPPLKV